MSNVKRQTAHVNKVELLSEHTSGVPPVILGLIRHGMVIIPGFWHTFFLLIIQSLAADYSRIANYSRFGRLCPRRADYSMFGRLCSLV